MKKLLAAACAALLWGALPAHAAYEDCEMVETLTLDSWRCADKMVPLCLALMPSKNLADPDNPGPSIFERHCLNVQLRVHNSAATLRTDFHREPEVPVHGSATFEAAVALPADVGWSVLGVFSGNNQLLVGTIEPEDFVGNIFGTGRCPDIDEKIVGGVIQEWRDITDPVNVTYDRTSKSGNTIQTINQLRQWKREGVLPEDTDIICGARFSVPGEEYRPDGVGEHVVLIEEESKRLSAGRVDMLREGKYQGASVVAEYFFNIRPQIPDLRVYDLGVGTDSFPSGGLFVKNEKLDEKHAAFCRFNQAITEALDRLHAGSVTKVGDGYVLDDAAAAGAFYDFMRVMEFEQTDMALTNSLKGSLEIKSSKPGGGIDHFETARARLDFFGFARENLWWGPEPTDVQLQTFRDWFEVPDVTYVDPCTYKSKA